MRWILVANHSEARIFKQEAQGLPIHISIRIEHPEGRLRNRDLKEGRPGRSFESGPQSHQRHALSTRESPREHSEHEFAKLIGSVLEHGQKQHQFNECIVVAEPGFLGEILKSLNAQLERLVSRTIKKDLAHLTEAELQDLFKDEPQD